MRCPREPQLEVLAVSDRQGRRVVSVGAVRGVLARRGGRWVVDNDSEVRLLEALRAERGARDRLWALAAALDAGVGAGDLRRLNGRLSAIAALERPEEVWRVRVPGDLLGAVAHVCVCVSEEMLSRWLGFALSARLDANLVRGCCRARAGRRGMRRTGAAGRHSTVTSTGSLSCPRGSGRGWRPTATSGFGPWRLRLIRRPGPECSRP